MPHRAAVWTALALAARAGGIAHAAPPADIKSDPGIAAWFKSLREPVSALPCCTIADCRTVEFRRLSPDTYEALVENRWYQVPDQRVLRGTPNPMGKAVACFTTTFGYKTLPGVSPADSSDQIEIHCFIPAEPTS